ISAVEDLSLSHLILIQLASKRFSLRVTFKFVIPGYSRIPFLQSPDCFANGLIFNKIAFFYPLPQFPHIEKKPFLLFMPDGLVLVSAPASYTDRTTRLSRFYLCDVVLL